MGVMVGTDTRFGIQWKIMELRKNRAQGMERTARGDGKAGKKKRKASFELSVYVQRVDLVSCKKPYGHPMLFCRTLRLVGGGGDVTLPLAFQPHFWTSLVFRKLVHRVLQGDRGNISANRYGPSELLSEKAIMDVFLQLKPTFPW